MPNPIAPHNRTLPNIVEFGKDVITKLSSNDVVGERSNDRKLTAINIDVYF